MNKLFLASPREWGRCAEFMTYGVVGLVVTGIYFAGSVLLVYAGLDAPLASCVSYLLARIIHERLGAPVSAHG